MTQVCLASYSAGSSISYRRYRALASAFAARRLHTRGAMSDAMAPLDGGRDEARQPCREVRRPTAVAGAR